MIATAPATPTLEAPAPDMLITVILLVPSFPFSSAIPALMENVPVVWVPVMMALFVSSPARIATLTPTPLVPSTADAFAVTATSFFAFASTVSFPVEVVLALTAAAV